MLQENLLNLRKKSAAIKTVNKLLEPTAEIEKIAGNFVKLEEIEESIIVRS